MIVIIPLLKFNFLNGSTVIVIDSSIMFILFDYDSSVVLVTSLHYFSVSETDGL